VCCHERQNKMWKGFRWKNSWILNDKKEAIRHWHVKLTKKSLKNENLFL
jgi:hypothetical protein